MRDGKNDLTDSELNLPPQVRSFFWFHVYFTVRRILFELGGVLNSLALPSDSAFNQTENKYDIRSFKRICAEFGISPNAERQQSWSWKCFRIFHLLRLLQNTIQISIQNGKV